MLYALLEELLKVAVLAAFRKCLFHPDDVVVPGFERVGPGVSPQGDLKLPKFPIVEKKIP
jgi:hypothetical protein